MGKYVGGNNSNPVKSTKTNATPVRPIVKKGGTNVGNVLSTLGGKPHGAMPRMGGAKKASC